MMDYLQEIAELRAELRRHSIASVSYTHLTLPTKA